jgi:iron complex transport system permease protein
VLLGGLVGAVLLLAADVVSRTLLPVELPVGVLTAVIGASHLIALLVRRTRRSS